MFSLFISINVEKAFTQDSTHPVYFSVAYIKTNPGKDQAYRDLLKNYSKKIFTSQTKAGGLLGWYLYEVLMPTGSNEEYNYVGISVTDDFKFIFDPVLTTKESFKKALPDLDDKKIDELMMKYVEVRSIVKREVYTNYTQAVPVGSTPSKYAWWTFQQALPGKLDLTEKWEKDNWTGIHKAAIELGGMSNWGVYTLMMPYNADQKYNYLTVNFFNDLSQYVSDFKYADAIKKSSPNMDFEKIFQLPGGDKKVYKTEMVKLLEYVQAPSNK